MWLVQEARSEDPELSLNAAVVRIGARVGPPRSCRGSSTRARHRSRFTHYQVGGRVLFLRAFMIAASRRRRLHVRLARAS